MQQLSLAQTGAFPKLFLDYLAQEAALRPFYSEFPTVEAFEKLIAAKQFSMEKRQTLVAALQQQYAAIPNPPDFSILLNERTFTVTTGHQLNIFTGPLYIIYKIITTVRLAETLAAAYPDYQFVPIYWMATEDHDFAEIASFSLFGQKYTWETQQRGAVGRMNPQELAGVLQQLPEKVDIFEEAYTQNTTLEAAVRQYMHELFGQYGLVSVSGDERSLKQQFKEVMYDDLWKQTASEQVAATTKQLTDLGYKPQLSAREINFFYLADGLRERIVAEGDGFRVNGTDLHLTPDAMKQIIETEPEKLSPNVVLRPVYQEVILPNLAYIGGPSEVPYWLQLKGVFEHYQVPFPALVPRNFALIITKANRKKLDKLGVEVAELFGDEVQLRRNYVAQHSENSLSLTPEADELTAIFKAIERKANAIDASLQGAVEAELSKTIKAIDNLEKRLKKAEERHFDTAITQLIGMKEKLFPGGGLQERKENFLNFSLNNPEFISLLHSTFNPLDFRFYLLDM